MSAVPPSKRIGLLIRVLRTHLTPNEFLDLTEELEAHPIEMYDEIRREAHILRPPDPKPLPPSIPDIPPGGRVQ